MSQVTPTDPLLP